MPQLDSLPFTPDLGLAGLGRAALPLQGVTVLAVEDSRYACEAMRLMCQRAGARLRRADTLRAARSHLRLYRPDVVVIDLGLPDGRGETLIRDLVMGTARAPVILGSSGNPAGRALALAAGADGFLDKPLESLAGFCAALGALLPDLPSPVTVEEVFHPDPLALRDDLARAAAVLASCRDPAHRRYLTGFVAGVASHAHDSALAHAAQEAGANPDLGLEGLRHLINRRLALTDAGFAPASLP